MLEHSLNTCKKQGKMGQSHEPESPSESPVWVAEGQVLGTAPAAPQVY